MRLFHKFSKLEKILVLVFFSASIFSFSQIISNFFYETSESRPDFGGVYSEAAVGDISLISPLFTNFNPIDRDISSLIFRGLMKYKNGEIVDDLATHTLSKDQKIYTFKVKEGIKWHDGKPLTIDDIYFTYHDILQSPDFSNDFFKDGLKNVKIEKISDTEITFTLEKSYKFFLTNLLVGILPKHILEGVPPSNLMLSDFNFERPVGLGPYQFQSLENFGDSKKLTLVRNEDFYGQKPYIDTFEYLTYQNSASLIRDLSSFTAIRPSQEKMQGLSGMNNYQFIQTKYVAAFLNTKSEKIKDKKTRLGLRLATDKNKILEKIGESFSVDNPLLELEDGDWAYEFDLEKARGALHESGWKKAEKTEIKEEEKEDFSLNYVTSHSQSLLATSSGSFFIEGKVPDGVSKVFVNDYQLKAFSPGSKVFAFRASEAIGTLKEGENNFLIKVTYNDGSEGILDKLIIFYLKDSEELAKKEKEIESSKKRKEIENLKEEKEKEENLKLAKSLKYRVNENGEILSLNLITDGSIKKYLDIAELLKQQRAEAGVDLRINKLNKEELKEAINKKDYDILLYGQSLGYNLDTYSYWHSSQTSTGGLNFSNLSNLRVDILIEKIRSSHSPNFRNENLKLLAEDFKELVPAIFLYSPTYNYSVDSLIKGVKLDKIANIQDRFSSFENWYIKEEKIIKEFWLSAFFKRIGKELFSSSAPKKEIKEVKITNSGLFLHKTGSLSTQTGITGTGN